MENTNAKAAPPAPTMIGKPLTDEAWREYEWCASINGGVGRVSYRITDPATLYVGKTTHRVVDAKGVVHCVPSVGELGCVLRWQPRDVAAPVQF